jgi:hypothetical protein
MGRDVPEALLDRQGGKRNDGHFGTVEIILEHHRDVAILRRRVVHDPAVNRDGAILFERLALFEPSLVLDWLCRNKEMTDFIAAADGLARALRSHGYDSADFGSFSIGNRSK